MKFKICLGFVLFMLIVQNIKCQPYFYSQSLQNLYYSLPASCRLDTPVAEMVIECSGIFSNGVVPIVYSWDNHDMLTHIGYRFLPDSAMRQVFNPAIVRFLEREFLSLLAVDNLQQKLSINNSNGMLIALNGNTPQTSFYRSRTGLPYLLQRVTGMDIMYEEGRNYRVTINCGDNQTITFQFVADAELVFDMDKKERDERIAAQLSNHKARTIDLPAYLSACSDSTMQVHNDSAFVRKGGMFIIPQINSDLYYLKNDSVLNLAFGINWIAETFSNVMLAPAAHNYAIEVTHRAYGGNVFRYDVNSRDFFDYFSGDYERFFGIEEIDRDVLTGTLILADKNVGNIHLGFVTISAVDLLYGGVMKITLNTNIPQHNIETLFGRKRETSNEYQYNVNIE